jgi:hypothetical protein
MFGINKFSFPDAVLENFEGKNGPLNMNLMETLLERQIDTTNSYWWYKKKRGGIFVAGYRCG